MTIDYRGSASADLTLPVALGTLLREADVVRAAEHLDIGQCAMSNSLRRLRKMLGIARQSREAPGVRLRLKAFSAI